MRVGASINEPFVLSTYTNSEKLSKNSKKQRGNRSVFATYETVSGSSDGYATIAAQADGVHVLDISTLHPVISHTLGPSTSFAGPAITRHSQERDEHVCSTYAAIASSSDLNADESGRTIWMWKQNLSGRLDDQSQKKKTLSLQHQISSLHTCDELPTRLFALSPQSELTVLDSDLAVKNTWPAPQALQNVLKTYCFSRSSCSFLPPRTTPQTGAILISFDVLKSSMQVRLCCVDDKDEISDLATCPISLKSDQILDSTCSPSGFLSVLTRDGFWHTYRLEPKDDDSIELTSISGAFRLTGLSFISKATNSEQISLLALSSSHVLLCALTDSPAPEIALLLWDLQYSVLLASHALPIPSTLTQSKDFGLKLNLVAAPTTQALLILSAPTADSGPKSGGASLQSSVLVLPFTCPETSTIANAIGRGSSGAKWMAETASSSTAALPHDPARTKLLSTMRAAMAKNLPQAANVAFFEWEKRESKTTAATEASAEAQSTEVELSHNYVKDLLTTVIQPSKPANTPYSSEIVRYLINRKLVSTSMLEGGLLAALRHKNDWESIKLALEKVIDLSEAEIMESLQFVITRHRATSAPQDDNAMEVDSVTDTPPVSAFLSLCVSYTTTPPALRAAMRRSLNEAEDIFVVLKLLDSWVKQWSNRDVRLLPSKRDLGKNAHGAVVLKEKEKGKEGASDLPSLSSILSFLQTLLDASFLIILQYPPAHAILRHLQEQIEPEITYIDSVEQLRGSLELFVKAQTKAVREAGQDKNKKPQGDWRQRRKHAHEQAGLGIGLYQLEEIVL